MGSNHARVLSSLEGVTLVAVVDENSDKQAERGHVKFIRSLAELIPGSIDFAVVATPTETHEAIAIQLLDIGIDILIEKPVAHTVASALRISENLERSKRVAAVGHIERFNPAIQELKVRLESGEIGEVYQIATRRQGSFPNRINDVGVVKDLATHDIDLVTWVCNSEYEKIFALTAHKSGRSHEDMISATGRLRNGIVVNHIVNWLSPMKERKIVVTGDKGTYVANTLTGDLTLYENGVFSVEWEAFATFRGVTEGNISQLSYPKKEPLRTELEGFRDYLRDGSGQIVSLEQGIRVLKVAEAMLKSQGAGMPVSL